MLVAFSVSPSGGPVPQGEPDSVSPNPASPDSVSAAVADAVLVVRSSGLSHRTDSMFTTIEGGWEECMDVVRRACEAVGRHGPRVSLVLKADIRPGHEGELTGKLDRLEAAVERAQGEAGRGQ
ncbi:MAG: thiamine-binding protein [Janthinobacterium lividum]